MNRQSLLFHPILWDIDSCQRQVEHIVFPNFLQLLRCRYIRQTETMPQWAVDLFVVSGKAPNPNTAGQPTSAGVEASILAYGTHPRWRTEPRPFARPCAISLVIRPAGLGSSIVCVTDTAFSNGYRSWEPWKPHSLAVNLAVGDISHPT
jgi:hypothetical protein